MKRNRFFSNTMGYFAEIVIAKAATTQTNYETFVASSAAGDLWAFWEEPDANGKHLALVAGDPVAAANVGKKYFYAYKDANLITKRTASIEVGKTKFTSAAYNAGTAQVSTATYGGTISGTQIIHARIMETTGTQAPFPSYDYSAVVGSGGIDAAVTSLRAQINAEKNEKFVTASGATNALIITSNDKVRTFKLLAYIETSPAATADASAVTVVNTTPPVYPIGTSADLADLFRYFLINQGATEFSQTFGTNGESFGWPDVALADTTQWGFFILREDREEAGVTRNYNNNAKVVIAIANAQLDELVALHTVI